MDLSRRSFLSTGSKLGFAAVFSGGMSSIAFGQKTSPRPASGFDAKIPSEAQGDNLAGITRDMFADNLGTKFTFSLEGVKLADVKLIRVKDSSPAAKEGKEATGGECFSVIFRGPRSLPLRQDTYTLQHGTLGEFKLLVVPGGTDKNGSGLRYGALINRAYS